MFAFGSHGLYEWLATDDQRFDPLEICPEIVLGKYVAVTSIDSGTFLPNDVEKSAGWESRGKIAYSPKVQSIDSLPREGYDEWYVFASPSDLGNSHLGENIFELPQERGQVNVFVNYGGFALHRPEMRDLTSLFWQQMDWVQPESYIADGNFLNFVSTNKAVFAIVRDAVKDIG